MRKGPNSSVTKCFGGYLERKENKEVPQVRTTHIDTVIARQVLQGRGKEFTGKVEPSVSNNG